MAVAIVREGECESATIAPPENDVSYEDAVAWWTQAVEQTVRYLAPGGRLTVDLTECRWMDKAAWNPLIRAWKDGHPITLIVGKDMQRTVRTLAWARIWEVKEVAQ